MNSQIPIDNLRHWFKPQGRRALLGLVILIVTVVVFQVINRQPRKVMCDLMDGYSVKTSEKRRILIALGSAGLNDFEFEGDRILVPKDQRAIYLNAVVHQKALPTVFAPTAEDDLNINPFMPRSQQRLLENSRKKRQIREMVMQLPFVAEACFEMDWAESNRAFQPDRNSAVVMIQPSKNHSLNRQQVETIKGLISGAIADIKPSEIVVTDVSVGIAYQDLDDDHQRRLIELVNWRISRQRHYRNRIESVLSEYDGVEIDVQIIVDDKLEPQNNHVAARSANSLPRRLPKPSPPAGGRQLKPRIGANSIASVPDSAEPNSVYVATQASYLQSEDDLPISSEPHVKPATVAQLPSFRREVDGKKMPEMNTAEGEVVNVMVRVPGSTIEKFIASKLSSPQAQVINQEKIIEQVKADIISRVRPLLPAASFIGSFPISVVIATDGTSLQIPKSNFPELNLKVIKYWPLMAVVLVGLLAMWWTRSRDKSEPLATTSVQQFTSSESDEEVIRSKLSSLIDQDPAAAAKVIENWIREAE